MSFFHFQLIRISTYNRWFNLRSATGSLLRLRIGLGRRRTVIRAIIILLILLFLILIKVVVWLLISSILRLLLRSWRHVRLFWSLIRFTNSKRRWTYKRLRRWLLQLLRLLLLLLRLLISLLLVSAMANGWCWGNLQSTVKSEDTPFYHIASTYSHLDVFISVLLVPMFFFLFEKVNEVSSVLTRRRHLIVSSSQSQCKY